jgi:hypothetical protein
VAPRGRQDHREGGSLADVRYYALLIAARLFPGIVRLFHGRSSSMPTATSRYDLRNDLFAHAAAPIKFYHSQRTSD